MEEDLDGDDEDDDYDDDDNDNDYSYNSVNFQDRTSRFYLWYDDDEDLMSQNSSASPVPNGMVHNVGSRDGNPDTITSTRSFTRQVTGERYGDANQSSQIVDQEPPFVKTQV